MRKVFYRTMALLALVALLTAGTTWPTTAAAQTAPFTEIYGPADVPWGG